MGLSEYRVQRLQVIEMLGPSFNSSTNCAQIIQTNLKCTLQAMWVIMLLHSIKISNMIQNCTGKKWEVNQLKTIPNFSWTLYYVTGTVAGDYFN